MADNGLRLVHDIKRDDTGVIDEQTLSVGLRATPDVLSHVLTHYGGKESKKFPLTFLSEGQSNGSMYKNASEINNAEFIFGFSRRKKLSSVVVSTTYSGNDKPGLGGTYFKVVFKDRWLLSQHPLVGSEGTKVRTMSINRVPEGYEYELQLLDPSYDAYCPLVELEKGKRWSMIGPGIVSESDSYGNESNVQHPGTKRNQLSFIRKSYRYAGNVANKKAPFVAITYNYDGKSVTNYMEKEIYDMNLEWRAACEEWYWESVYNRNKDGKIELRDPDSGKPIPTGAGAFEQVDNDETYGEELTHYKVNTVVGDAAYGSFDAERTQYVFECGTGFRRQFDEAMKTKSSTFTQITGDKFTTGHGRNLSLTGFFTQFEHVDGHTVLLNNANIFDHGGRAEASVRHPKEQIPLTSFEATFLDQSNYNGQRNIQMVSQKGRGLIKGMVPGMAPKYEGSFGFQQLKGGMEVIATEQDRNTVHMLGSKVVNIFNSENCVNLRMNIS